MRNCRKCNEIIPVRAEINGRQVNLQNRKFCLKCSPFNKHNTSKHDPIERRKYSKYSEKQKDLIKQLLYKRAFKRKLELVKSKGGGCCKCGYNKCLRALEFHHENPEDKLFGLSINNLWSKSWEEIEKEAGKCILVCANCHREIEEKISSETLSWYNSIVKKELLNESGGVGGTRTPDGC